MRARAVALVCFLLVAIVPVLATASPASASPPTCNSGTGNGTYSWYGGLNQNSYVSTVGSQAIMTWQEPDQWCSWPPTVGTHYDNTVSEWVAITGKYATNEYGIIQAGMFIDQQSDLGTPPYNEYYDCMFSENSASGGGSYHPTYNCGNDVQASGTPVGFYNMFNSGCPCEVMGANIYGIGNVPIGISSFDPTTAWSGINDFYSTETEYNDTTAPGNSSMPVLFTNVASQAPGSTSFTSPPPGTLVVFMNPEHHNTCVTDPLFEDAFNSYHQTNGC